MNSSSQLACYGPLAKFIVDGQLPASVGTGALPLSPSAKLNATLASGKVVIVDAGGSDAACREVAAGASFATALANACTSLARALAVGNSVLTSTSALTICVRGSIAKSFSHILHTSNSRGACEYSVQ